MTRPATPPPSTDSSADYTEVPVSAGDPVEPAGTATDTIDQAADAAVRVWETRLFSVQDATVTVGQIVIAIGVLILGVVAARVIARHIGSRVLPRMRVEPGPAHALQAIVYYTLLSAAIVLALQIAAVPLTVFTIFGGAIALGIGFGSQNIVNNFISGLVLLIEQPVQVGHYIEIDGDRGEVRKIGARATHIAEYSGARHIVPNSKLLEHTVTNWHLPDPTIRSVVGVGVAYGTDVSKVRKVLWKIVKEDKQILQNAENVVLFTEFGDSTLNFEIQYWHKLESQTKRRDHESELRFAIDRAFRDAGIVIAFPQRDVHLDTPSKPIEVRVLGAGDQANT